ncbi:MAG: diacylglycerol kinase family lipid kinase [Xanthomonadales bacterium]|nr:diacylglycerol kinase family lipid kinase [Gammaproteobacteria bacterium]MBT8054397.1 diacylglycerol kinase family lipid kinase [Gammaproteobacteria bacterium]NND56439.1 diacylglycerol kinase family lipid kinase [Xanthomonadales bacterium]NNK51134.1 diacylglycerol kinase family lipid kinase [Xanthomonadales bacterium]
MRLLLVFNPSAASGRAARLLPRVQEALERFARIDVLQTAAAGDAVRLVAAAELAGYDGLIAAGGDGTLFEVLNGLYHHQRSSRVPLGLVPVGTGNAFARDLGLLPGDWQKAVELVRADQLREVDVGQVETGAERYFFLNIVGAGLPVDAMKTAARIKFIGNTAYTFATLWRAMKLRSYPLVIEMDGQTLHRDSMFVEVSNTRYTGTSFLIAPGAKLDDGLLDVTLLDRLSRLRLLRLFPTIYKGRHVRYPEISTYRAKEIRITAPAGLVLAPDGELSGRTPATITCLHRDLEIFAPA